MANQEITRRSFIKGTIGATTTLVTLPIMRSCVDPYDAKGLPTTILGKTGVRIPRVALGLGSRFCNISSEKEAHEMLNYALDNGLYYWDTAWIYENKKLGIISEERLGEVVKARRNEIFLSTKVTSRDPDEAMRQIESSLKRLQTDKLDMLKIHSIESLEDINQMSKKGMLIDIVQRMKDEGVCRFTGFSGHGSAEAMKAMAERANFDSMLIAMNHWGMKNNPQKRQELAVPAAKVQQMGVMLMKVVRPRETVQGLNPEELIRFALSLKGPDGIVLGVDSKDVVKSNLKILHNFQSVDEKRMKELAHQLTPFYNHENLPWMEPTYRDGHWV